MAEGIARNLGWNAFSAGVNPAEKVSAFAVEVMQDIGIDISHHQPENIDKFTQMDFEIVVTVCDHAHDNCPVFTGSCKQIIHHGFEDPYHAKGTYEQKLKAYTKVRNEIYSWFEKLN